MFDSFQRFDGFIAGLLTATRPETLNPKLHSKTYTEAHVRPQFFFFFFFFFFPGLPVLLSLILGGRCFKSQFLSKMPKPKNYRASTRKVKGQTKTPQKHRK